MDIVYLTEGADLDALASAYGITLLNDKAKILFPNGYSTTVRLATNIFKEIIENKKIFPEEIKKIDKLYIVDSHNLDEPLKKLKDRLTDKTEIFIYDHHPIDEKKEGVNYIIKNYGSATTITVEEIRERGINISSDEATLLALGIYEDTGSFKYNITKPQDLLATAFLLEKGANLKIIRKVLEKGITEEQLNVIKQLTDNIQYLFAEGKKIIISTAYTKKYIPDISSKIGLIRPFQEADAFFALINTSGKVSIIGRSRDKSINVGNILSYLGGGGHISAGSATIKGLTTYEVKNYLESIILGKLYKNKQIKDIMARNVKLFSEDLKISDIKNQLKGQQIILVKDKNNKFSGIVYTKTLNEAIKLKKENLTLSNFVIDDIITFTPDMNITEAEKYLINSSQEIFPVLKNGNVVGLVSRGFLLKAIHGQIFSAEKDSFISRERIKPKVVNYINRLRQFIPKDTLEKLEKLGEVAQELGYRAYIVGGIVRDIVMGRKNLDIDILVEGDARELAKRFAKRYGYKVNIYGEFLTAQVILSEYEKWDFATARTEIYEYAGAYPKVKRATLKEDLYRRDFTINTLAIEITKDNFGNLIDYFNGLKDIKDKVIRILKQLSFIEDPIRILRAVRFAGRFGFKLGKATEKLLKLAIDEEILKVASPHRVNQELKYIFNEEKVLEIINLMNKYKILHQLIPEYKHTKDRIVILTKVKELITTYKLIFNFEADKIYLYLNALLYHLPFDISYKFLEKYGFVNKKELFEQFYELKDKLKKLPPNDSDLYDIIKNVDRNVLIFISAYFDLDLPERILKILNKEDEKKLILSGKDLINLGLKPSPEFKRILEDIFKSYLDNKINTKEEALNYVKRKYIQEKKDDCGQSIDSNKKQGEDKGV